MKARETQGGFSWKQIRLLVVLAGLLFVMSPVGSRAEEIDFEAKVTELKTRFPQGKYWNHVGMTTDNSNGCTDSPCTLHGTSGIHVAGTGGCTCNHFADSGHVSATQCMGFANKLGYDVFGDTKWTTTSNPTAAQLANIKVGDIVRYSCAKEYTTGHSVFVIGVSGTTITIGEANYGGACKIVWNRTIDLSSSDYTVLYYEHANNYDSVIASGTGGVTGGENGTEGGTDQSVAADFTGWKTAADGLHQQYYKKGVLQKSTWLTISKKKYYVDSKGYMVTGFQTIKKKDYYFNSKGVMLKKQWFSAAGKDYYANGSGYVLKSQWLYKGNLLVYVKKDGAVAKSELYKIGSKTYYFNAKGKRSKGFKKCNGKYYYCNSKGVVQKKKWLTIGKKKYYLQKSGVRAQSQLLKIGKYRYYFNDKGCMVKSKKVTYKDKIYKADKKGRCKYVGEVKKDTEETEE
jgi:glucan-binding repeat-containing protein